MWKKAVDAEMFRKPRRTRSLKNAVLGRRRGFAQKALEKQRIHQSVDIWALGAIIYSIIYGHPPGYAQNFLEMQVKLKRWQGINK